MLIIDILAKDIEYVGDLSYFGIKNIFISGYLFASHYAVNLDVIKATFSKYDY